MRNALNKTLLASSILLALGVQPAFATNGMAPTGIGQTHKAMGGAAAGYAANTMSMATNPAAASFVSDGYDVGAEVFIPNRSATFKGASYGMTNVQNDGNGDEMFLIPEAGFKKSINDRVAVGVTAYGNGGMNTAYDNGVSFFGNYFNGATQGRTGIDLKQLFVSPTVSYKLNDKVAVGASANLVYQRFEAHGLGAFQGLSANGTNLTDQGGDSSTGVGVTVGIQGKLTDKVTAGASYRSKTNMSKFDKYSGLFPNQGEFDVPAAATVGIAVQATPKTLIAADVENIQYSDVAAMGNAPVVNPPTVLFGSSGGPGFGWKDQTVYKLGVKHQVNDGLALMAGYNYGESPIDGRYTTMNVLAPGVVEQHVSLGFEKRLTPRSKLTGSYVHAFDKTVSGNAVPPTSTLPPMDAFDLKMKQDAIGIGYSMEF